MNVIFWAHGGELRLREPENQRNRWKAADYEIPTEQLAQVYPLDSRHLLLHDDFSFDEGPEGPHLLTKVAGAADP